MHRYTITTKGCEGTEHVGYQLPNGTWYWTKNQDAAAKLTITEVRDVLAKMQDSQFVYAFDEMTIRRHRT